MLKQISLNLNVKATFITEKTWQYQFPRTHVFCRLDWTW